MVEALLDYKIVQVVAGPQASMFRTFRGEVFACGTNTRGQLGVGDTQPHVLPQPCKFLLPVVDISVDESFSIAATASGMLVGFAVRFVACRLSNGDVLSAGEIYRCGECFWINEMSDQKRRFSPTRVPTAPYDSPCFAAEVSGQPFTLVFSAFAVDCAL